MIFFNTSRARIYCKIIHNYLEAEIFGDLEIDIGDRVECYMPKYLFREQYQKCIDVFRDLYEWTNDVFIHELTAFHEVALYYFLREMENVKEDMQENFKKVYYDTKIEKEIRKHAEKDLIEIGIESDLQTFIEEYYEPNVICEEIFEDIDFIELPHLYNEQKADIPVLAKALGINLDYYFTNRHSKTI